MRGERLKHTLRLFMLSSGTKRARYLKEHDVFGSMGDRYMIMNRIVPLYAKLIKLGSNVNLASKVSLVTHDVTHSMLNKCEGADPSSQGNACNFHEKVGCIEIGDNVFVGAGTTVLYNVRIGSNVIIGANSLVNKDIPDNSVAAGVPAKVISSFEDYLEKRKQEETYPIEIRPRGEAVSKALADWCWERFYSERA